MLNASPCLTYPTQTTSTTGVVVQSAGVTDALETHAFVYAGPRQFAGLVAQTLRDGGLLPESWIAPGQPPSVSTAVEPESLAEILWITPEQQVTVVFLVCCGDAQLRGAIAQARERLQGRGTIDWQDAAPSTANGRDRQRRWRADSLLSTAEFAAPRT